jgi:MFS family permease
MKAFHGWRMVAAGTTLQLLQAALMQQAFGAYVAVLAAEKGWSKTALSGGAALQSMESAVIGPVLGWLCDRFGPYRLIRIGVLIFGVGMIALSRIDSLGSFYAALVVIALGTSLAGYFPINIAVIHWFERYRARALSIVGLGMAVGGLFVPLVAGSMQTFGWRSTAMWSGVLIIVLCGPISRLFKDRPQALGQEIDGDWAAAKAKAAGDNAPDEEVVEFTAREALRTRAFWLVSLGHGFALLAVTAVNVHAITLIKESLGYTVAQASLVITLMTASQIAGVLAGMAFGDRLNKRLLAAFCMLMHGAGLMLLAWAQGLAMLVGFALLHGAAWGLRGPLMQAIRADYFGRRSIGMIMGLSTLIVAIGQIGGPMIAGGLADITGNYRSGFTVLAVLVGLGSLLFYFASPPPRPVRAGAADPAANAL